jgi:hypothetical protein
MPARIRLNSVIAWVDELERFALSA